MKLEEGKFYFEKNKINRETDLIYIHKIVKCLGNEDCIILYEAHNTSEGWIEPYMEQSSITQMNDYKEIKNPENIFNLVINEEIDKREGESFIESYKTINKYKKTNNFKAQLESL